MAQKKYIESGDALRITSKINYDLLDTIVGLNIKREIQAETKLDSRLRLFLKVGWRCQALRKHFGATVQRCNLAVGFLSRPSGMPGRTLRCSSPACA
jgi:hypothetical protein